VIDDLMAAARARLRRVQPEELAEQMATGALIVDTRPLDQRRRDGPLPGSIVVDRSVLEWRLDPASESRISEASYDRSVVIVCNEGYSSSLAAATLQELGLHRATDLVEGFQGLMRRGLLRPPPEGEHEPTGRREGPRTRELRGGGMSGPSEPPLFQSKDHDHPSVFRVENLIREARRQRHLQVVVVPAVCLLDPDGDTIRHLRATGEATRCDDWVCYHSELWLTEIDGRTIGIVPCAVGAPYAVLVAEQLAASGCSLIISITSAGMITPLGPAPYFVLIERAWRDEGTSVHYVSPAEWSSLARPLWDRVIRAFDKLDEPVHRGLSWTTDAPFRETAAAIERAERAGIHAVEMEAAALYAFAEATGHDVVCIAHVTNSMATAGDDFEKGEASGTYRILALTAAIAGAVLRG
jgi:uridine phosphorylase/rhodanese-related sulfurtransferase